MSTPTSAGPNSSSATANLSFVDRLRVRWVKRQLKPASLALNEDSHDRLVVTILRARDQKFAATAWMAMNLSLFMVLGVTAGLLVTVSTLLAGLLVLLAGLLYLSVFLHMISYIRAATRPEPPAVSWQSFYQELVDHESDGFVESVQRSLNWEINKCAASLKFVPKARGFAKDLALVDQVEERRLGLLELRWWVNKPNPDTYGFLKQRVRDDLLGLLKLGWHSLPVQTEHYLWVSAEVPTKRPKRTWGIILSVLTFGGVIATVVLKDRFEAAFTYVILTELVLLLAFLGMAGVSVKQAQDTVSAAAAIKTKILGSDSNGDHEGGT